MPDHRQKKLQKHKKKRAGLTRRGPGPGSQAAQQQVLERYFVSAALTRPFGPCFVTRGWDDETKKRLQCVVVTHELDDASLLPAALLVDLGCEGIKDAFVLAPVPAGEGMQRVLDKLAEWFPGGFQQVPPHVASAIAQRGQAWGEKLGFETPPRVLKVLPLLDSSEFVSNVEVPLGRQGKPLYAPEPDEDTRPVIQRLAKALGPDGFVVELPAEEGAE